MSLGNLRVAARDGRLALANHPARHVAFLRQRLHAPTRRLHSLGRRVETRLTFVRDAPGVVALLETLVQLRLAGFQRAFAFVRDALALANHPARLVAFASERVGGVGGASKILPRAFETRDAFVRDAPRVVSLPNCVDDSRLAIGGGGARALEIAGHGGEVAVERLANAAKFEVLIVEDAGELFGAALGGGDDCGVDAAGGFQVGADGARAGFPERGGRLGVADARAGGFGVAAGSLERLGGGGVGGIARRPRGGGARAGARAGAVAARHARRVVAVVGEELDVGVVPETGAGGDGEETGARAGREGTRGGAPAERRAPRARRAGVHRGCRC